MNKKYTLTDVKNQNKAHAPIIAVFLFYPLSDYLVYLISNYTKLRPTHLTLFSLVVGLISVYFIYEKDYLLSATCFAIFYLFDCADGKLARLTNQKSRKGDMLDHFGGDILLFILSFSYLDTINPISPFFTFLIICTPFLVSLNNSIAFYSKLNFKSKIGHKGHFFSNPSKSRLTIIYKFRKYVESSGIYFRLDNTDSIMFVYFLGPIFFYYNYVFYGFLSLGIGVLIILIAIIMKIFVSLRNG